MTIRVMPIRGLLRSYLLPVSSEPVRQRAATKRPSSANEGGPQLCPFLKEVNT